MIPNPFVDPGTLLLVVSPYFVSFFDELELLPGMEVVFLHQLESGWWRGMAVEPGNKASKPKFTRQ